jgi:hypothetical protein
VKKVRENLVEIRRNAQAKTPTLISSNLGYNLETYQSTKVTSAPILKFMWDGPRPHPSAHQTATSEPNTQTL